MFYFSYTHSYKGETEMGDVLLQSKTTSRLFVSFVTQGDGRTIALPKCVRISPNIVPHHPPHNTATGFVTPDPAAIFAKLQKERLYFEHAKLVVKEDPLGDLRTIVTFSFHRKHQSRSGKLEAKDLFLKLLHHSWAMCTLYTDNLGRLRSIKLS